MSRSSFRRGCCERCRRRDSNPAEDEASTRLQRASCPTTIHRQGNLNDPIDNLGEVEIFDDRGERREASQLAGLMAGVDEPTYNNVFAVGLKEIQELGSLDDTAAADYLYRLTSGLDRVSLVDVIREVATARERLLASDEKATSQTCP